MSRPVVLYSVLDWGLGHATRSIPLIRYLLNQNYEVILVGEGRSAEFLKKEFPELKLEKIKGFTVHYPENKMAFWVLRNLNPMLQAYRREIARTKELVTTYTPELIVSDHRYGFFHPGVRSILVAHQLRVRAGIFTNFLHAFHNSLLKKFDEIWVPDAAGTDGLSAELSHHPSLSRLNIRYIGRLSRLQNILPVMPDRNFDAMAIISGPEPQRSHFEALCREAFRRKNLNALILQGTPETTARFTDGKISTISSPDAAELKGYLQQIPIILCRPGYSTLMDLFECGRNAILVPTPGQTEQEYLAKHHSKNGFTVASQHPTAISSALEQHFPSGFTASESGFSEANLNDWT